MRLTSKLSTAKRLYQKHGLEGIFSHVIDRGKALPDILHSWWWSEHPMLGRMVEWRGNLVKVDGLTFNVDHPTISRGIKGLFLLNRYEQPEREALQSHINPALPIIELGASLGVVSCLANKKLIEPSDHVAVEANPDLIPLLKQNRDRNKCKFTVIHAALAYSTQEAEFLVSDSILASSATMMDPRFSVTRKVTVRAITLKDLITGFGFPKCTLICDIECGEVELVRNEIEVIKEHVSTIIIEIHNTTLDKETVDGIVQALNKAGFRLVKQIRKTYVFRSCSA